MFALQTKGLTSIVRNQQRKGRTVRRTPPIKVIAAIIRHEVVVVVKEVKVVAPVKQTLEADLVAAQKD